MPKITEMFAYIAEDEGPDDEGVIAHRVGDTWVPLVGGDMKRMKSLRAAAKVIARTTGQTIKLVKFSKRTELEIIEP